LYSFFGNAATRERQNQRPKRDLGVVITPFLSYGDKPKQMTEIPFQKQLALKHAGMII